MFRVSNAKPEQLAGLRLSIIGSPTQGGRPTSAIQDFLNRLPEAAIRGINVAAFDTRLSARWVGIFGYAAGRIADSLKRRSTERGRIRACRELGEGCLHVVRGTSTLRYR